MAKTFKILSALLSYPTAELRDAAADFPDILRAEALLPARSIDPLSNLCHDIATRDLIDSQERYVLLFDRTRSLSLHLFEHVHGESRDRGQAMVDLANLYEEHGLAVTASELPDYLPLFLEFLSLLPDDDACALLGQPAHVIAALGERLRKRKSPYRFAVAALVPLAGDGIAKSDLAALLDQADDDPNDLVALDRTWEEAAVTFGPSANTDGCTKVAGMVNRLNAQWSDPNG